MDEQRQRAKQDARSKKHAHADLSVYRGLLEPGPTSFVGYERLDTDARVLGLLVDGELVESVEPGQSVEVVLDTTSFYAESGGQIADEGLITGDGVSLRVRDVQRPVKGLVVHTVDVEGGLLRTGADVRAQVDHEWRISACQAHSGTHVVHAALRQVLGPTALQSGSYNKPGYLRLDFAWAKGLSADLRSELEDVANLAVRADLPVSAQYMTLPEAREWGALALFGETYDEQVRVVEIGGPWSRELCGGTHVAHSSQVGALSVISESSVGAGVRRVEALVGIDALRFLARERALVAGLADELKVRPEELPERVAALVARLRAAEKELESARLASVLAVAGDVAAKATDVGGVLFAGHRTPTGVGGNDLRTLALDIRGRLGEDHPAVVTVVGDSNGKPGVVVATNRAARDAGLRAGGLVKVAAGVLGGNGGGKDDVAQGGGVDLVSLPDVLTAVEKAIANRDSH